MRLAQTKCLKNDQKAKKKLQQQQQQQYYKTILAINVSKCSVGKRGKRRRRRKIIIKSINTSSNAFVN